jgi:hypothetical protein
MRHGGTIIRVGHGHAHGTYGRGAPDHTAEIPDTVPDLGGHGPGTGSSAEEARQDRAVQMVHATGTGTVLALLGLPAGLRDPAVADAMFDGLVRTILADTPAVTDVCRRRPRHRLPDPRA